MTDAESINQKTNSMLSLERLAIVVAIFGGIVGIAAAVGVWWVMPYRVELAEKAIAELRSEIKIVRDDNNRNQELLVRMDERIKTIQTALKIPTSQ